MTALFERLRRALAPGYEVQRELASGGMGIVYLGYDPALRRRVAIKLLRPELATAAAASRFLREARLLAKLNHRAVVTIFQAGEADGLFYYVMELIEGDTLADRIAAGEIFDQASLTTLAHHLLEGLEAIHQLGMVHRDLKPANILFRGDQAVIADFGIALSESTTSADGPPAIPHAGTPAYMSPEQMAGDPIGPSSDLYNIGMILFEAATGSRWRPMAATEPAALAALPGPLIRPITRALESDVSARWPNARAMLGGLDAANRTRRGWVVGGAFAVVAIASTLFLRRFEPPAPSVGMAIRVTSARGPSAIAESVTVALRNRLAVNPDFHLSNTERTSTVEVSPAVEATSDRVELRAALRGAGLLQVSEIAIAPLKAANWRAGVDTLADRITEALLLGETSDPWLPLGARPTTQPGIAAWLRAEHAYRTGEWEQAYHYYREAEAIDSTCLLCLYRLNDVDRWLAREPSAARIRRLALHVDRFPPHYQALIRANALAWPDRFDSLHSAAVATNNFALAWFAAGDEAFHRAALYGRSRQDARDPLIRTTTLKPRFAPGWEHLAWLALGIGDSVLAARALDSLDAAPLTTGFPGALRAILHLGFAWRFLPETAAQAATNQIFAAPSIRAYPDAAAGPRVLMTMGSPNGALYFGRLLAGDSSRPEQAFPGLLGALFGATALGMTDTAAAVRARLGRTTLTPAVELFLAEWEVVEGVVAGTSSSLASRQRLADIAAEPLAAGSHRQRAAWLLALTGDSLTGAAAGAIVASGGLGTFLAADSAARRGDLDRAIRLTDTLPTLDVREPIDPFLPLMLRVRRATWLERMGRFEGARKELRSGEHLHYNHFPNADAQAGEVDWSFGTELAWRRAALLDPRSGTTLGELCHIYHDVGRLWAHGATRQATLADSATRSAAALGCSRR